MNLFCFGILLAFSLWLLPAPSTAFIVRSTGCHHNGTWYADKSLVPTVEKCLNCQCSKKSLICRLKVCPEMPMPPPRGCVVVQKKNTCCPYLSCARLEAFYKIPITRRIIAYLDHYERESIDRVVNDNMLQRRSDDSEVDLFVCVKNGTVYKSGSAMSSSNLCTYCYCIGGNEKCVKPKCMLPVEGCKPIFVDSTCCPVRYDCSVKTSGKSSQEVRYRKTANKHFLRMSQRPQRNRGCTINKQFYAEGQKMKSDPDKPCDVCFCIRGSRRCAPKKCSPALKNCLPVVPKGQCCPSSYDCGSQRDYSRSHNSRQFNLFSLLFGKDDNLVSASTPISEHYPHDRDPALATAASKYKTHGQALEASSEKSILETLREGLEFIDGNTKKILQENEDLLTQQAKRDSITSSDKLKSIPKTHTISNETKITTYVNNASSTTTEISFLDLLLGEADDSPKDDLHIATTSLTDTSNDNQDELSWVDILLGPTDTQKFNSSHADTSMEVTTNRLSPELITSIDRLDDDFDDLGMSGEILVSSNENVKTFNTLKATEKATTVKPLTSTTTTTTAQPTESTTTVATHLTNTTKVTVKYTIKPFKTEQQPLISPIPLNSTKEVDQKLKPNPTNLKPATTTNPLKKSDLLDALFGGISDMLSSGNIENITSLTTVKPFNVSTTVSILKPTEPLPVFKPLPARKQHTRINSKIANFTVSPPTVFIKPAQNSSFKPLPPTAPKLEQLLTQMESTSTSKTILTTTTATIAPTTETATTAKVTTKKPHSSTLVTTSKPLIIKTNPTILEAEPLDDSTEPTLPPSLPNLKIIPFLPTDAVEASSSKMFEYAPQASNPNYEMYPAITEHSYAAYAIDLNDDNKAKYIYKFRIEGPAEAAMATATSPKNTGDESFLKYEFVEKNGFSPPTKTEGGFLPKDPLPTDDEIIANDEFNSVSNLNEIYQATMRIIDITTAEPLKENQTKIIDITTPDPFKDVIHTESPPDLAAIIQDKLDNDFLSANSTYQALLSKQSTNNSLPQRTSLKTTPVPTTLIPASSTFEHKNSIETLLNILFKEERNEPSLKIPLKPSSSTSTLPSFKGLPQTSVEMPSATKPTTTAKPKDSTTKTTLLITTTTNRPQTTNTTSNYETKHKTKINTNQRLPQVMPTKLKKPLLPNIRKSTSNSTLAPTSTLKTSTLKTSPTVAVKKTSSSLSSTTTSKPKVNTTLPTYTQKSTKSAFVLSTTTSHNPFLMSPFDKLPFMDASFEIKRHQATSATTSPSTRPLVRLDGLDAAYEISNSIVGSSSSQSASSSSSTTTTIKKTTLHPPVASNNHSMSASNSLIDPTGILKLAGCNIYGRMYRVGRIILELSSPCVECKCTEIGVKCGQLDC